MLNSRVSRPTELNVILITTKIRVWLKSQGDTGIKRVFCYPLHHAKSTYECYGNIVMPMVRCLLMSKRFSRARVY